MKEMGEYRLDRLLGRGATAQVYSATRKTDQKRVALKIFHPGLWVQENLRRRALAEYRTVSSLKHSNIIQVYEPHWDWDPPAVVMEWVDGFSLEEFQARLPYVLPEVAVLVILEVLEALHYAHGQGVIHRDLKPANILVSREGKIYVSDFGLAKIRDVSRVTLSGTLLGSPDYMSPEQARGEAAAPQSDLFSVAAILYYLVTGTRPFTRHTPLATLAAVGEAQFDPAQRRNPKLSPGLARILNRGLARNPQDRFESAEAFSASLRVYLQELGLQPEFFNLALWVQEPTETVMSGMKLIAHGLTEKCETLVKRSRWDEAIETLSHLGQVAPESSAIPRMMGEVSSRKQRAQRRKWLSTFGVGASLLSVLGGVAWFALLPKNNPKPGLHSWPPPRPPMEEIRETSASPVTESPPMAQLPKLSDLPLVSKPAVEFQPIETSRTQIRKLQRPKNIGRVQFDVAKEIRVYWDGVSVDSKQVLRGQKLGRHQIRLEKPGSSPIHQEIWVSASEPTLIRAR